VLYFSVFFFAIFRSFVSLTTSGNFSANALEYAVYSIGSKYLQRNKVANIGMQYALRLCIIIVTLEMKRITIYLQLIFIRKPEIK